MRNIYNYIYIYVSKPRACITLYYYLLSSNSTQFFDPKHSNPKKKKNKNKMHTNLSSNYMVFYRIVK